MIILMQHLPTSVLAVLSVFFFYCYAAHRSLHSFPTRRSSDLRLSIRRDRSRRSSWAVLPKECQTGSRARRERLRLRSEEHTSELQSLAYLVCRLLLEKKKQCPWPVSRLIVSSTRSVSLRSVPT